MPKRLVYLGTPEVAIAPLLALCRAGHDLALVVTRPDRRRSRGATTSPSPVKAAALELGLPVTHDPADVIGTGAELGVVVAYGRLIRADVLASVPMVNVHFSLLPRWRGAAPVERALLAGDEVTGVCIMAVDETLDTGAVYARASVPIGPTTTAAELRTELVDRGTDLLLDVVDGELPVPAPQVGEPTYADKIAAGEWELNWHSPAEDLDRWVRAGPAWTTFRGKRLRVLAAAPVAGSGPAGTLVEPAGVVAAGTGAVRVLTVQPAGRGPMSWRDFAHGAHPTPGEPFGSSHPFR